VLLWLDAVLARGLLAERQEATQLVAEGGEGAQIAQRNASLFQLAATIGKEFLGARVKS
jgi:hypothetical protein